VLFPTTVRYWGRLITKDGVRFDPKNMEALQTKQEPQNGADLVQYVAAAGSDHKAHGKMASLFEQPYISPPDYDISVEEGHTTGAADRCR
jgi:hypothetical protein